MQRSSCNLSFGCEYFHSRLAQIKQNSVGQTIVSRSEFNRRLYRNAVSSAPFAIQQGGHGSQAGSGFLFGEGLVEHEMRAAAKNVAHSARVCNQCNRNRWLS